jgi:hypothetical protein
MTITTEATRALQIAGFVTAAGTGLVIANAASRPAEAGRDRPSASHVRVRERRVHSVQFVQVSAALIRAAIPSGHGRNGGRGSCSGAT